MSCSRRHFMAGMSAGALIMMTTGRHPLLATPRPQPDHRRGTLWHAPRRDGLHRLYRLHGCLPGGESGARGVSRLEIIRSGPIGTFPDAEYHFFRKSCQHCDNAPCVHVCPTGASHIRKEDGIVDVNPDLCVGCMYCLAACPYQVRFINPVTKVADKCDFCRKTNLAAGKEPACVESCPTKALVFGNLDDPDSPIAKRLVKETTYRYKQALGTSPKMYRVPKGEIKS